MKNGISVFGLGYVGCVSAACFAKEGFNVIGVDTSSAKVELVNDGRSTVVEEGIGELVFAMRQAGRLSATTDSLTAVRDTEVSLICVGTPSLSNGSLDLSYIVRVCQDIGNALRSKSGFHTIVIRSTVLPGTIDETIVPELERASGRTVGDGFGVVSNPEFLREGSSIRDFYEPPFTLIGADDERSLSAVKNLYAGIEAPVQSVSVRTAEMVKYACNSFHGLKVAYANEIGVISKALGVDGHEVMRLVCEDRKLNISSAYMRPGFAFGGSCLPKDLRALTYRAREMDVELPVLSGALKSNEIHRDRAFDIIAKTGARKIGVLGLAFKAGTDDLREAPVVALVERLIGKGYEVVVYDRDVSRAKLIGANKDYIEREIPHIWSLFVDSVDEVLSASELIVIGNGSPEFREVPARLVSSQFCLDLVRTPVRTAEPTAYEGICWN
jgi:GDP-mannose 6-dehydrogenase